MPPPKKPPATQAAPPHASLREEDTDDGWVLLRAATAGRPPRPPRSKPLSSKAAAAAAAAIAPDDGQRPFDPGPEDLVGRYLPARRTLRCDELPPNIHDADVYAAHPAFLGSVYPEANGRLEWFFFVCRGRGLGGKRRAGAGAYRLVGEAGSRGAGARHYCHSFRYHEDAAGSSAARETEWRMDEYGERGPDGAGAGGAFDMVVCKVYPARGGALHERLRRDRAGRADVGVKPQVLVQLHLAGLSAGDPLRCRVHPAADVCAAHPAVLTAVLPAANDHLEWFFAVRRARSGAAQGDNADEDGKARPLRAGPGAYVPAARYWCARDRKGRELGYRRVFRYRKDDDTVRRLSPTEWWMEEYGFGPDFPYGEHREDEELVVYKVYLKMAGHRR